MVNLLAPGVPSEILERSGSPSTSDLVLDNAAVMLSALRKISSISGVPFLNEAAIIAVRLVNLIRDVRDNNDGFRTLGMDAGKLVWTISTECERLAQAGKSVPPIVQDHIKELVTKLRSIEEFIESKMLRRRLQKIIAYATDKSDVLRYREVLRTALDSFALQASIASQEALHHIGEAIDAHRVEVIFDRIHQTDAVNRLMQQQAEQMEQLRLAMAARYTEEDRLREEREYYARVEHEQQASVAALRAAEEEERLAEEERLWHEQEQKDAEKALLRKRAAERLKQIDQEEAEKKKQRREQAREERETREAIAIVEMQQEAERQEARRRKKELERQHRQEEEEAHAAKKAAAAKKEARIAAQEAEDAKEEARRRQQRKAEKQRREDDEEHDEAPLRRKPAAGKGTHITATQVEITVTRKGKGGTTKTAHKSATGTGAGGIDVFDGEKFARDLERKLKREFDGFEAEFLDSSSDEEYWSDDPPPKCRVKSKKAAKASARAGLLH